VTAEVSAAHRKTLEEIFGHPSSANIEWRRVRSLLEALGAATDASSRCDPRFKFVPGDHLVVADVTSR